MAVLAYAFPGKEQNKFKILSFVYVYPYFHQSWEMFVPIPKQNYYVYIKYDDTEWKDLFYDLNSMHQRNRLKGHENLMLSLGNSARYYASSVKSENAIGEDDDSNIYFNVLKKIIVQYITLNSKNKPQNLQLIIRIKDTENNSDYSHYYKVKN